MALLTTNVTPKNLDGMISRYDVRSALCIHKKFKEKVLPYIFLHVSVYPTGYILNVQECLGLIVILETDYGKVVDRVEWETLDTSLTLWICVKEGEAKIFGGKKITMSELFTLNI